MPALVAKPDKLSCFLFPYHRSVVIYFIRPLKFAGLCRLVPHYHRSLMITTIKFPPCSAILHIKQHIPNPHYRELHRLMPQLSLLVAIRLGLTQIFIQFF
jgi:hypothetical protein